MPPQDIAAEQGVLGGMMLSKDAIADVVEVIKSQDFYRPAHELIYDAILDLYSRGEPADPVTVSAELTNKGELSRVGGTPYLHDLISTVPTAANAAFYARIVGERAVLRRLVEAGTRIVQMGYGADGMDVEAVVNSAQAEMYAVTEKRTKEDYAVLGDVIEGTIDEIEASSHRGEGMVGVPTGFADLDSLTNGLHPGQMIVIAARPAVGKALALDTPLPTPTGWTTMGEVAVGDELIGADGEPTRVVAATEVMHGRPCYEVRFSDGSAIVADAQHQWAVDRDGRPQVVTTEDLLTASSAGNSPLIAPVLGRGEFHEVREVRPVDSVPVRCVEVSSEDHLYLAGPSRVPTHNSTLGLDIARAASIKHGLASVIFSLEMGRNEIAMRLLSAEARVPLQKMRKGTMDDADWTRFARTMGSINEAPLYIDDSPNMSLMEIRSKCRRLKQRADLKLVIVDYLQLMTSGKRVESRQQEVSEFSRALKLLAKEIEVPVIALSQLNRGPEQRTDKRPMVSDLRESGCLTGETRVLRADTGAETTLQELLDQQARDVPVWALDESLRYVRRHLTHVFPTGRKPVFRLRTASGKEVRATGNHPFLTLDGWKPLDALRSGQQVAVPRHVPAPERLTACDDDRVVSLARALADGAASGASVPLEVPGLPKRQVALFLSHLWAGLGAVAPADGAVRLGPAPRRLLDDAARLLLRFGITVAVRPEDGADGATLEITGRDDIRRFLREVGVHGRFGAESEALAAEVAGRGREALADPVRLADELRGSFTAHAGGGLATVVEVLRDADLDVHAVNDVLWDEVVAIEPDGEEQVYDATVVGGHNFVANGIAVHNSIEQDADMVILLHREDMYEKESPRAGEADFIVAKHRNGPTDTITVAFQGHYSRFVDMAT
ncbi:replicative DNA helicase [Kineococcus sp. SYSU DK002]|uniref:replicative DNA helicase n=1 Tax=Kineococcus sp. SYSU DK002 TaxID=3383123 RepID=UPI003D7C7755